MMSELPSLQPHTTLRAHCCWLCTDNVIRTINIESRLLPKRFQFTFICCQIEARSAHAKLRVLFPMSTAPYSSSRLSARSTLSISNKYNNWKESEKERKKWHENWSRRGSRIVHFLL